jgi:hypothetical protein
LRSACGKKIKISRRFFFLKMVNIAEMPFAAALKTHNNLHWGRWSFENKIYLFCGGERRILKPSQFFPIESNSQSIFLNFAYFSTNRQFFRWIKLSENLISPQNLVFY